MNGGEIEQIQFLLGHASVLTAERYLGCKQNLEEPVRQPVHPQNVRIALSPEVVSLGVLATSKFKPIFKIVISSIIMQP
jgi:hypothetical protein